jgi:SAM-dependent methyltransferase
MNANDARLGADDAVLRSYDSVAENYAQKFFFELDRKPLDRALLSDFALLVQGAGRICDVGCGPGHVARYVKDRGVDVFGIDLSPKMVAVASRLNRDLEFREGTILALDVAIGSLAGIVAFYSIVNFEPALLPRAFAEMHRVVQPGRHLLIAFHIGREIVHRDEFLGQPVDLTFFLYEPDMIAGLLIKAGFQVDRVVEREPYSEDVEYPTRRAYVFASKPLR